MFFTWGLKETNKTSQAPAEETVPEESPTLTSIGSSDLQKKQLSEEENATPSASIKKNKGKLFPVYDFSLKEESIPFVSPDIAPEWESFGRETDPYFKTLVELIEEQIEPLTGFGTKLLIERIIPQKTIQRKPFSSMRAEEE